MNAEQVTKTVDIIANIYDFLDKNEITFEVQNAGITEIDGRGVDRWLVCFTSNRGKRGFYYHTGTGLRNKDKKPVPPCPPDVLYCLMSDFFSAHKSPCCEDATKLVKVFSFTQLSELQEILQDY